MNRKNLRQFYVQNNVISLQNYLFSPLRNCPKNSSHVSALGGSVALLGGSVALLVDQAEPRKGAGVLKVRKLNGAGVSEVARPKGAGAGVGKKNGAGAGKKNGEGVGAGTGVGKKNGAGVPKVGKLNGAGVGAKSGGGGGAADLIRLHQARLWVTVVLSQSAL